MNEKDLNSKDIFFKPEDIKKAETTLIPAEYIPIKLSSVGKLGIPNIIHIRDYSFEEAIALSEISEDNETEVIIQILNSIIYEDIDAGDLHKNDALEILMTIQGTWYTPRLEDMPYYLNPELSGSELNNYANIGKADLPFSLLVTKPIKKEAKVPITIKYRNTEVKFVLPKIKNEVIAFKIIESKYSQEENELAEIKKKVEKETATIDEIKEYEIFLRKRTSDFIKINQALLLESFNGKTLETLDEKLEVLPKLSLSLLKKYTDVVTEHFTFGIDPVITFMSEELNESITRRFDFRTLHFLSSMEQVDDSGFDISFG